MRAVVVAFLLCAPLAAEDESWLADAVKKFKSEQAGERDAATQAIKDHLKKELGPLLEAMKSDDPEVSRRARQLLEALLPPPKQSPQDVVLKGSTLRANQLGFFVRNQKAQLKAQEQAVRALRAALEKQRVQQQLNLRKREQVRGRRDAKDLLALIHQRDQAATLLKFGVAGQRVMTAWVEGKQKKRAEGYMVTQVVQNSPAVRLGIQKNDIILTINGKPASHPGTVASAIGKEKSWLRLKVRVMRSGKQIDLAAKPGGVR